jgi:hypothetical protein
LDESIHECKLAGGEMELEQFIGNFVDTNDYGERPNWEILLIHMRKERLFPRDNDFYYSPDSNNDSSYKTVVVFKLDHGLGDGYTYIYMVKVLTGTKSPYLVQDKEFNLFDFLSHIRSTEL